MQTYLINNKPVSIFADHKGDFSNKFNRAAWILSNYRYIEQGLKAVLLIEKPTSLNFKASVAELILLQTGIRVGNEDSAEGYTTTPHPNNKNQERKFIQTYGLTTLKNEHFFKERDIYKLKFIGKKGVPNTFTINDPNICTAIDKLLQNNDPEHSLGITDSELTKFIKYNTHESLSPKDFRTAHANTLAWNFLSTINPVYFNKKHLKPQMSLMFTYISGKLNNLPSTAKKNYVCPEIIPYMTNLFSNTKI